MDRDFRFYLSPRYSNAWALIIGIDDYTIASPLSYAVSDAEEVRKALIEDLNFPADNITLITNEEATKETIFDAYMNFASDRVAFDDRIIVFFAGHGCTQRGIRGDVGYLVPVDGDPDRLSTLIRWDDLTKNAELIPAKHMLFIMDACYGGLALTRHLAPGTARFLKDMLLRYSRQVLTAGKADQVVSDSGGPIPDHSVFTGHLLQGLRGGAVTDGGILTANGLMSYVHAKVATDKNSNQTPHFGCFEGDGDFILKASLLNQAQGAETKDIDTLVLVQSSDEPSIDSTTDKIQRVKQLLASEDSSIELHDFVMDEVKAFLATTGNEHFPMGGTYSPKEALDRIGRYEKAVNDLSHVLPCIAYWGKPTHLPMFEKAISRTSDSISVNGGLNVWLELRWYPIIIELYCSGVAAVAGRRYDSLASILGATVGSSKNAAMRTPVGDLINEAINRLGAHREGLFRLIPGHERFFTPLSEYLFKFLQPRLDDLLYLGDSYEGVFDEFEILLGLVTCDLREQRGLSGWGPIGRFGWKHREFANQSALTHYLAQAESAKENWAPLKAGLFGGQWDRFKTTATAYSTRIGKLMWH